MGEQRAKRFMLVLLGLQRLSYLVPSVVGQFGAGVTVLGSALLGATLAWNVAVFVYAWRRGWFPQWVAWMDIAWAAVLVFAVPAGLPPSAAHGPLNSAPGEGTCVELTWTRQ